MQIANISRSKYWLEYCTTNYIHCCSIKPVIPCHSFYCVFMGFIHLNRKINRFSLVYGFHFFWKSLFSLDESAWLYVLHWKILLWCEVQVQANFRLGLGCHTTASILFHLYRHIVWLWLLLRVETLDAMHTHTFSARTQRNMKLIQHIVQTNL